MLVFFFFFVQIVYIFFYNYNKVRHCIMNVASEHEIQWAVRSAPSQRECVMVSYFAVISSSQSPSISDNKSLVSLHLVMIQGNGREAEQCHGIFSFLFRALYWRGEQRT